MVITAVVLRLAATFCMWMECVRPAEMLVHGKPRWIMSGRSGISEALTYMCANHCCRTLLLAPLNLARRQAGLTRPAFLMSPSKGALSSTSIIHCAEVQCTYIIKLQECRIARPCLYRSQQLGGAPRPACVLAERFGPQRSARRKQSCGQRILEATRRSTAVTISADFCVQANWQPVSPQCTHAYFGCPAAIQEPCRRNQKTGPQR